MPRTYRQSNRAELALRTRRAILDAARAALLAPERLDVNIGDVAAAAGVARSTVYAVFGSRSGLLAAVADDALHSAGLEAVIAEYMRPDAAEALEQSLRANCRMYAADRALFKRLIVLAEIDPDAAAPLAASDADRARGMSSLAERLAGQSKLRGGISLEDAANVLSLLTSFASFDELYTNRRLSAEACAETLVGLARSAVLAPR